MTELITKTCPVCGKKYQADVKRLAYGRQATCSRECSYMLRGKAQQTKQAVNCERCGKMFYATPGKIAKGRGKYCSKQCTFPPHIATCKHCGKEFRYSPSAERQFCSAECANQSEQKSERSRVGTIAAWENPNKRKQIMDGIRRRSESEEWRSAAHFQKGEKHPRYKGNRQARAGASQYQYKKWHKDVLQLCNYTCQQCGKRGGRLEAHHVKPWALNPELRFDAANGIALCEDCHLSVHGRNRKPITKICVHCGTEFRPKKRLQKYCTKQCFFDAIKTP